MICGYARVSTHAQDLSNQVAQLKAAGCGAIFREKISGATTDRPQLKKFMAKLSAGDVVVTPAVDRLSRDTTDLLVIARNISRPGAYALSPSRCWTRPATLPSWCLPCSGLPPNLNAAASWNARHAGGPTRSSDGNRYSRHISSARLASGSTRARHSAALPGATTSVRRRFRGFDGVTAIRKIAWRTHQASK
jgi:hypothetical protein